MFNSLKIKLHVATRMFQKKPTKGFVNPYAPAVPEPTSKINPYITDYGTKKKKSIEELIVERVGVVKGADSTPVSLRGHSLPHPELTLNGMVIAPATEELPSFTDDMKEMFKDDLISIAIRFANRPKKEKVMTADEIRAACENTKWQ